MSHRRVGRRSLIATLSAAVLAAGLIASQPVTATGDEPSADDLDSYRDGNYVVIMSGEPAASYTGGVDRYRRTAPRGDRTYDSERKAAREYTSHLRQRQERVAASVGAEPYYNYTTALNGFAADLTAQQASEIAHRRNVLAVVKDQTRQLDTWHTPDMLELSGSTGLWRRLGGANPKDGAGKGTIIGVVDSGIDSDNASFAPVGSGVPKRWNGVCQKSADDAPAADFECNDKLIGGRYFAEGHGDVFDGEFLSPEDFGGHGTHTASTAAGNSGVDASAGGIDFGKISGMAPAAKVASYKVCWQEEDPEGGGCSTSDSVAAIDAAVKDGVDVINYSISGSMDNPVDPVELAFMYAADAGVFVATSAGNNGPAVSSVAHPSPWVTTVANATHYRYEGTLEFGNGHSYVGASVAKEDVPRAPIVTSRDAKASGASEEDAALCLADTLDPGAVEGKIVICDRGENPRAEKSQVVADAGGMGMVLTNVPGGSDSTVADLHAVPTIHVRAERRDDVYADAKGGSATARIRARVNKDSTSTPPPAVNSSSSRGPTLAADGDLLKPDVAAPGTDVLAAVAPERNDGRDFGLYTGTSMAAPHIAGLALLFEQKYPDWSPMQIKSAMMTTAADLNGDRSPFSQGAGFVAPRRFFDPGLVFDSDFDDWTAYLAGQGVNYPDGTPISDDTPKASNLNTPSIAVNDLAGKEAVTRTVTNVDDTASTYTIAKRGLKGVKVTASPSSFTIAAGATQRVRFRFERTKAATGEYASGRILLRDGSHRVRVPVVVKPTGMRAPESVRIRKKSASISTKSGVRGIIEPRVRGLVPADDTAAEAEATERDAFDPDDERNYLQRVTAKKSTEVLRVQTMPDFPADDLDLYVFDPNGNFVGQSATAGSDEQVTVADPVKGKYYVYVQAWSTHASAATTSFALRAYTVGEEDTGTLAIRPQRRRAGIAESSRWELRTSDLEGGAPYLGVVDWTKPGKKRTTLATTFVTANH